MSLLIKGVKHHDILENTVHVCLISILTKQILAQNFAGITSLKLKIVAFTTAENSCFHYTYKKAENNHTGG